MMADGAAVLVTGRAVGIAIHQPHAAFPSPVDSGLATFCGFQIVAITSVLRALTCDHRTARVLGNRRSAPCDRPVVAFGWNVPFACAVSD